MIFMANRFFKVVCLAALVVFPAHSQDLSVLDHAVAITTSLQFITEDDVDQRTKLNLLLAQKQASREEVIGDLGVDVDRIARAESAGLSGAKAKRWLQRSTRSPSHSQNVNKQRPKFPRRALYVRLGHFRLTPERCQGT